MPLFNPPSNSDISVDADGFVHITGQPPFKYHTEEISAGVTRVIHIVKVADEEHQLASTDEIEA